MKILQLILLFVAFAQMCPGTMGSTSPEPGGTSDPRPLYSVSSRFHDDVSTSGIMDEGNSGVQHHIDENEIPGIEEDLIPSLMAFIDENEMPGIEDDLTPSLVAFIDENEVPGIEYQLTPSVTASEQPLDDTVLPDVDTQIAGYGVFSTVCYPPVSETPVPLDTEGSAVFHPDSSVENDSAPSSPASSVAASISSSVSSEAGSCGARVNGATCGTTSVPRSSKPKASTSSTTASASPAAASLTASGVSKSSLKKSALSTQTVTADSSESSQALQEQSTVLQRRHPARTTGAGIAEPQISEPPSQFTPTPATNHSAIVQFESTPATSQYTIAQSTSTPTTSQSVIDQSKPKKLPANTIIARERKRILCSSSRPQALTKAMQAYLDNTLALLDPFRSDTDCWLHPSPYPYNTRSTAENSLGSSPSKIPSRLRNVLSRGFSWYHPIQNESGRTVLTKSKLTANFHIVQKILLRTLTLRQKNGWIDQGWHCSHLCGNWTCLNEKHVVIENGKINLERNNCFMQRWECEHTPKCLKELKRPGKWLANGGVKPEDLDADNSWKKVEESHGDSWGETLEDLDADNTLEATEESWVDESGETLEDPFADNWQDLEESHGDGYMGLEVSTSEYWDEDQRGFTGNYSESGLFADEDGPGDAGMPKHQGRVHVAAVERDGSLHPVEQESAGAGKKRKRDETEADDRYDYWERDGSFIYKRTTTQKLSERYPQDPSIL